MSETARHITYEDAGVDTAEGGRAVDAIKQMVSETSRPKVIGGIGGFGGLFSAAALKDMEDLHPHQRHRRRGHQARVGAQVLDRHETVGQDLCCHVRERYSCERRRAPLLLGLCRHRSYRGRAHGQDRKGRGRWLQACGLCARGRRDGRASRRYASGRLRYGGLHGGRGRSAEDARSRQRAPRRCDHRVAQLRHSFQRLFARAPRDWR